LHAVLDVTRVAVVDETVGQVPHHPAVAFPFAQQDAAPIAGEVTTPEIHLHFSWA
jgi:hypothetical protein